MITLEVRDVEVDYCSDCGGIWFDAGELELLLDDPQHAEKLINSFKIDSKCAEKPRKCPICRKKMQKIIVIEKCRITHYPERPAKFTKQPIEKHHTGKLA